MSNRSEKRKQRTREGEIKAEQEEVCIHCGEKGAHYVPPGFGDPGFFSCDKEHPMVKALEDEEGIDA